MPPYSDRHIGRIPYTDGKRSRTGLRLDWSDWRFGYSRAHDMNTNGGFNDYEEVLHVVAFGPLQIRWYQL